jgi:hypothetical protein
MRENVVHPVHIQQPFIEQAVRLFRGEDKAKNPGCPHDALEIMRLIDAFSATHLTNFS